MSNFALFLANFGFSYHCVCFSTVLVCCSFVCVGRFGAWFQGIVSGVYWKNVGSISAFAVEGWEF